MTRVKKARSHKSCQTNRTAIQPPAVVSLCILLSQSPERRKTSLKVMFSASSKSQLSTRHLLKVGEQQSLAASVDIKLQSLQVPQSRSQGLGSVGTGSGSAALLFWSEAQKELPLSRPSTRRPAMLCCSRHGALRAERRRCLLVSLMTPAVGFDWDTGVSKVTTH